MVLDCLPLALPCSHRNTSKQRPLWRNINPWKDRLTWFSWAKNIKFKLVWKTGMGSAWLQTKHVHGGRPGVPAPAMIKRNPIFHHLWRSEQYSAFAFFISQSKSDFHYQHIIRVPAGLFALKSCSCCCCPLPFKLRLFREPFLQSVLLLNCSHLWKTAGVYPKISFCQTIIFPEYYFARISCCQSIVMPNFQNLVLQNIKLPKAFCKWVDSFELVSLCCISGSSFVVTSQRRWFHWNHHPL